MRRSIRLACFIFAASIMLGLPLLANAANSAAMQAAFDRLTTDYPGVQFYREGDQVARIYGRQFGGGASAEDAAERFRQDYSNLYGIDSNDLIAGAIMDSGIKTVPLMYDQQNGQYKFTLVYYSQYKDGIPVYKSDLKILVKNESGFPVVLAASALKNLGSYQVDPAITSISPIQVQKSFASSIPSMPNLSEPKMVIWAGIDNDKKVTPTLGVEFIADNGQPATERKKYIINPSNGEILYEEDLIIDINVTGQVNGLGTQQFFAEQCGNEITRALPYAQVAITGGSSAYANEVGQFVITNGGSTPVTVTSQVRGHWFASHNQAGSDALLSMSVTPPGPANFLHNPSNTEYIRAEVNAYIHANIVRDYALSFNPSYPVINTQTNFPLYVNDNTGYCPGNAWYDGVSLTFCRAASGYPNTAFSTVVYHEYGHHLVNVAGSGQGEYGEGMGDAVGSLITDNPGAAWGFFGPCDQALRNADNTMQYPCSGEIHYCGQLISGCVWSTRTELQATHPLEYRTIISDLAINSILMHTGTSIAPDITIDYLTLDDDDGNINNGTPHWAEICAGFGAHNMDCPVLILLSFSYPNGKPSYINPNGGTAMRVTVSGIAGVPQPNTGKLYYNSGSGWINISMTQITPNVYDAVFPSFPCGTNIQYYVSARTTTNIEVKDPSDAPTTFYTTICGTGLVTLYQDDFSTNQGWTGIGGSGEWTIGVATGGSGSDTHGGPDPAVDHSPSSDNRVLGNDLASGTGGDYSPNLSQTYWITSPTINCSNRTGVNLSFWRWLGVERNLYDHAYFEVYNGASWVRLFENGSTTLGESAWSQWNYNVSTYANNNANFKIRFGLGITDVAWEYCGWNIDDILVTAVQCDTVVNGTIAGNVTDNHGAVANAIAHAANGSGINRYDTTASNGAYAFSIPPGTYSVSFTQIDHRDTTATGIVVVSSNTTMLNMVMTRLPGIIRGTVTHLPSGAVSGAIVTAIGASKIDTSGINGAYILSGITDGSYNVSFSHLEYRDTTANSIAVTPGDTTTLNMVMREKPGWISGIIRDTSGVILQNVFVKIGAIDSMFTDINGFYISYIPTGSYSVRFTRSGYRDTTIAGVAVTPNDTTNVSPRMKPVNYAPVITSPDTSTAVEHQQYYYLATATDPNGTIPTINFLNIPPWAQVQGNSITGIPGELQPNTTFRVIASDGELADTMVVNLTVIQINDPPHIVSPDTATANEHQRFKYVLLSVDPDGPYQTRSFSNYPSWLTVLADSIFGYPLEASTDTSFFTSVTDGQYTDTMTVSLHVILVNDPPIITSPDTISVMEHELMRYVAAANDPEGGTATISFISLPHWLAAVVDTVSGIPNDGDPDTVFSVVASDGLVADTMIVSVNVIQDNDPPQITSPDTAVSTEHLLFSYTATAVDPNGTTPAISIIHIPSWMSLDNHTVAGTPGENTADTSFTIIAFDGLLADTMSVSVRVILINDPPVITSSDSATATVNQPFIYIATAYDPEGATPLLSFRDYPSWAYISDNILSGIPPLGAADTSFMVMASDGMISDSLQVNVNVTGACSYSVGDVNGSGAFNGLDVTFMVAFFKGGAAPTIECDCPPNGTIFVQGDVNASCSFNGLDVTYSVTYFKGGQNPTPCPDCAPSGGPTLTKKDKQNPQGN